ncbi:MAG: glucose-1-phosphate cytidylyltransferase [Brevinemataceae bacterium]
MKVVILAGGMGTRLGEETNVRPKPLVEIGGLPIIWHIMKYYSSFGYNEFVICLGYKGFMIKEFFMNYMAHLSDLTIDFTSNETRFNYSKYNKEPWKIHLVHTGDKNMTGSRIKQIASYIDADESFFLTYGDGVADVDIPKEVEFHKKHGKIATMLAVQPQGRFGALRLEGTEVYDFEEKPQGDGHYINGGYFILNKKVFEYLDNSSNLIFEQEPLQNLAKNRELQAFTHNGFWQCMDNLRDKQFLEELWVADNAPWKK